MKIYNNNCRAKTKREVIISSVTILMEGYVRTETDQGAIVGLRLL